MTSRIVFEWTHSNFLSVYTETPSQLFENSFDRRLVGKVYEDHRFMTFWKRGKMRSKKIGKHSSVIESVMKHVPEVREMIRKYELGEMETVGAKTVVVHMHERVSMIEKLIHFG